MDADATTMNSAYISPYHHSPTSTSPAYSNSHENGLDNANANLPPASPSSSSSPSQRRRSGGDANGSSAKKSGRGFETFVMTGDMIIRTTSKSPQHKVGAAGDKKDKKQQQSSNKAAGSPKPSRIPKPATPKSSPKTTPKSTPAGSPKLGHKYSPRSSPKKTMKLAESVIKSQAVKQGVDLQSSPVYHGCLASPIELDIPPDDISSEDEKYRMEGHIDMEDLPPPPADLLQGLQDSPSEQEVARLHDGEEFAAPHTTDIQSSPSPPPPPPPPPPSQTEPHITNGNTEHFDVAGVGIQEQVELYIREEGDHMVASSPSSSSSPSPTTTTTTTKSLPPQRTIPTSHSAEKIVTTSVASQSSARVAAAAAVASGGSSSSPNTANSRGVRTSKSHENYLESNDQGGFSFVDIDFEEDNMASSVDALHYEQSTTSLDNLMLQGFHEQSRSLDNSPERRFQAQQKMPTFISLDEPRSGGRKAKRPSSVPDDIREQPVLPPLPPPVIMSQEAVEKVEEPQQRPVEQQDSSSMLPTIDSETDASSHNTTQETVEEVVVVVAKDISIDTEPLSPVGSPAVIEPTQTETVSSLQQNTCISVASETSITVATTTTLRESLQVEKQTETETTDSSKEDKKEEGSNAEEQGDSAAGTPSQPLSVSVVEVGRSSSSSSTSGASGQPSPSPPPSPNKNINSNTPSRAPAPSSPSSPPSPDDSSMYHQPLKDVDRPSAARLAKRLYNLDGFRKTDISKHLSKKNEFAQLVGEEFLKYFDLTGLSLDQAVRTFLRHITLAGETQERERVLAHFSRRYMECNPNTFNSEDAAHTLTCALLLLNTDLHNQNIGRKMSVEEFIENLADLNDGENYPKDVLRNLYNAIKLEPLEFDFEEEEGEQYADYDMMAPGARGGGGAGSADQARYIGNNPFLDTPDPSKATEFKKGFMMRKCCVESDGRKTPVGRRGWKMFFVTLRDLVIYLHKDEHGFKKSALYDNMSNAIRVHHALATIATDYKKKQHVFRLQTADWAEFLFQTSNSTECKEWMDCINLAAATLSAPPLPSGVGSQKKFQRPLLPASLTKYNIREQLLHHEQKVEQLERELHEHRRYPPERGAKSRIIHDYMEKETYLQFELKRFKRYSSLIREKMVAYPELEPSLVEVAIGEVDEPPASPQEQRHATTVAAAATGGGGAGGKTAKKDSGGGGGGVKHRSGASSTSSSSSSRVQRSQSDRRVRRTVSMYEPRTSPRYVDVHPTHHSSEDLSATSPDEETTEIEDETETKTKTQLLLESKYKIQGIPEVLEELEWIRKLDTESKRKSLVKTDDGEDGEEQTEDDTWIDGAAMTDKPTENKSQDVNTGDDSNAEKSDTAIKQKPDDKKSQKKPVEEEELPPKESKTPRLKLKRRDSNKASKEEKQMEKALVSNRYKDTALYIAKSEAKGEKIKRKNSKTDEKLAKTPEVSKKDSKKEKKSPKLSKKDSKREKKAKLLAEEMDNNNTESQPVATKVAEHHPQTKEQKSQSQKSPSKPSQAQPQQPVSSSVSPASNKEATHQITVSKTGRKESGYQHEVSDRAAPNMSKTAVQKPNVSKIPVHQPSMSKIAVQQPNMSQTAAYQPNASKTAVQQPNVSNTAAYQPNTSQTAVYQHNVSKTPVQQPNVSKTAAYQPHVSNTSVSQPTTPVHPPNTSSSVYQPSRVLYTPPCFTAESQPAPSITSVVARPTHVVAVKPDKVACTPSDKVAYTSPDKAAYTPSDIKVAYTPSDKVARTPSDKVAYTSPDKVAYTPSDKVAYAPRGTVTVPSADSQNTPFQSAVFSVKSESNSSQYDEHSLTRRARPAPVPLTSTPVMTEPAARYYQPQVVQRSTPNYNGSGGYRVVGAVNTVKHQQQASPPQIITAPSPTVAALSGRSANHGNVVNVQHSNSPSAQARGAVKVVPVLTMTPPHSRTRAASQDSQNSTGSSQFSARTSGRGVGGGGGGGGAGSASPGSARQYKQQYKHPKPPSSMGTSV